MTMERKVVKPVYAEPENCLHPKEYLCQVWDDIQGQGCITYFVCSICLKQLPVNQYQEKRQAQIVRYKEIAEKLKTQSQSMYDRANELSKAFEGGQPILVGHHSEKRARRLQETIHRKLRKANEYSDKAKDYEKKAEAAEKNSAISSDDPEAKEKLLAKIAELETKRDLYKKVNKIARNKKIAASEKIGHIMHLGFSVGDASKLIMPDKFTNEIGFANFEISNLTGNINATKKRLEKLEKIKQIEDQNLIINNCELIVDTAANRVKILFPDVPEERIRERLKGSGFVWSPSTGTWMRKLSQEAIRAAKQIIEAYGQG